MKLFQHYLLWSYRLDIWLWSILTFAIIGGAVTALIIGENNLQLSGLEQGQVLADFTKSARALDQLSKQIHAFLDEEKTSLETPDPNKAAILDPEKKSERESDQNEAVTHL